MSQESARPILLVVDDDRHMRRAVRRIAARHGCEVLEAASGEEGLELLDRYDATCAFIDHMLPGMLGLDVLRRAVSEYPDVGYVLFTAEGDADIGFEAHRLGADYTVKRGEEGWLVELLHKALNSGRLKKENAALRRQVRERRTGGLRERSEVDKLLLGPSAAMESLRDQIQRYAASAGNHVLILGESGVGKEVVARALYAEAGRPGRLITLNSGALPENLAESHLFGHEKGSFTGADSLRIGAFEGAGEGFVFLDEIGDLPYPLQVNLVRVLENRVFHRVGSTTEYPFRGRVIAATHQPVEQMIADNRFRQDLRWRFSLTIHVPPLREHPEDIPVLAMQFLKDECSRSKRAIRDISRDAWRCLTAHEWRDNNVRELRNAITHAVTEARGDVIEVEDLPPTVRASAGRTTTTPSAVSPLRTHGPGAVANAAPDGLVLPDPLLHLHWKEAKKEGTHRFGRWYVMELLRRNDGNVTHAARDAGVKRPNFHRLMKQYLSEQDIEHARNPPQDAGRQIDPAAK